MCVVGVSHTTWKYELRRNVRSHSFSAFYTYVHNTHVVCIVAEASSPSAIKYGCNRKSAYVRISPFMAHTIPEYWVRWVYWVMREYYVIFYTHKPGTK